MAPPYLSIVMPAYNEQARLPESIPKALEFLTQCSFSWELRVVDDGSEDNTCAVVEGFAADEP